MTIVCFGEILVRLSPPGGRLMAQSESLDLHFGGAETNVAVSLAHLGANARVASVLGDDALCRRVRAAIMSHGVDVSSVVTREGRAGIYFLETAAALRPADVLYYRANSAFCEAPADAIDWGPALKGARWLHMSGISPALGQNTADATLRAARAAKDADVPISFDGNYRGKLWAAWRKDGGAPILRELFSYATLAFANEKDISLVLGKSFDDATHAAAAAFAAFPNLQRIASTTRHFHDATRVELGAFMIGRDAVSRAGPHPLGAIVDRIGAGDSFAAGLLYSLSEGMNDQDAVSFALAACCLKHGIVGDWNLSSAADVRALLAGGAPDVKR